jgi:uncharacterized damage-inducible protein DinB
MHIDEVKLLFEYHYWATKRILDTCANLSEEQYTASTDFGRLRQVLVHIVESDLVWRTVLNGTPVFDELITENDLPTLDALVAGWQEEQQAMRAYLNGLTDVNITVRYPIENNIIRERVLWHCLVHVVNHGTQHRSEAAAMLTHFGYSPGELDLTAFLNEYFNLPS